MRYRTVFEVTPHDVVTAAPETAFRGIAGLFAVEVSGRPPFRGHGPGDRAHVRDGGRRGLGLLPPSPVRRR
ncbi:hypothetical protein [Streptomyces sp. NPDC046712]|uniref:hypothetical protein n=1 Tax=Streptomyces sp. NPDC046712 TaxID=3154802 RepID=UPI0033FE5F3F